MTGQIRQPDVSDAAIEIRGLKKEYAGGDGLHGLDLSIPRGCTFGLLGPNGAGKSTTIKLLMGLIEPSSGEARVNGYSIRGDSERIRACVGYVPERHHIYPWMTIDEAIWFTRAFYPNWDDALCGRLLKHYDLHFDKKVKELSHGMTTKLALVLALSHDPDVLLLDEPTTGLDPLIREEFLEGIVELLEKGSRTVLLSSHIMTDIEKVADVIGIINEGRLLVSAPRIELTNKTKRIDATMKKGQPIKAPPATLLEESTGEHCRFTVRDFSTETLRHFEQQNGPVRYEVRDLTLEEIFKAFIKGARK